MKNKIYSTLQPHLGDLYANKPWNKPGLQLHLAKILIVHHKNYTADVQLIDTGAIVSSSASNEGRYAARILSPSAFFDDESMTSSGVVEPYQAGQLVTVAFLSNKDTMPIILGSFHNTFDENHNVLPKMYPINPDDSMEEFRENSKYLRVHPSQFYYKVDGIGAMEMSHPSGTFIKMDPDLYSEIDDSHNGFGHTDLTEKNPMTGDTRTAFMEEQALPIKFLLNHLSSGGIVDGNSTTATALPSWTKFFIDEHGMLRVTRDPNNNSLSYFQLDPDGTYTLRRQLDSSDHGQGSKYTELKITNEGEVYLTINLGSNEATITVTKLGEIQVKDAFGGELVMSDGDIYLQSTKEMRVNGANSSIVYVSDTSPSDPYEGMVWIDTSGDV
jgi:hypothetical protein